MVANWSGVAAGLAAEDEDAGVVCGRLFASAAWFELLDGLLLQAVMKSKMDVRVSMSLKSFIRKDPRMAFGRRTVMWKNGASIAQRRGGLKAHVRFESHPSGFRKSACLSSAGALCRSRAWWLVCESGLII